MTKNISIDANGITDWDSFHDVFAKNFGFPDFYGRNMNAWNDCMTYLDDSEANLTSVQVAPGDVVVLVFPQLAISGRGVPRSTTRSSSAHPSSITDGLRAGIQRFLHCRLMHDNVGRCDTCSYSCCATSCSDVGGMLLLRRWGSFRALWAN